MVFARWLPLPENRLARFAVQRVAAGLHPGGRRSANPLLLHGPAGVGKSHLVNVLVRAIARRVPGAAVTCLAATNWGEKDGTDARRAARGSELIVIEDLQHLPVRGTEEFAAWFDELHARRVQMVFTALAGPAGLGLPGRLASRLGAGLAVRLEPLATASRLKLLWAGARRRRLRLSHEVLSWLAERLSGSGRDLEGALHRLDALARAHGRPPDLTAVASAFDELTPEGRLTVERILRRVSSYFRIDPKQLQSARRGRDVLLPRQVGMYLARQLTGLSLAQIGASFGGRDHSTVLHACRKVERALGADAGLSSAVRSLRVDFA